MTDQRRSEAGGPVGPVGPNSDRTNPERSSPNADRTPNQSATSRADRTALVQRTMTGPRRMLLAWYGAVLTVALVGQSGAATHWLKWWAPACVAAVAALEIGGVAVSRYANARRELGERAIGARLVSAAFAAFAVAVNWQAHLSPEGNPTKQAWFFAGFSAVGYITWLLDSGARQRDARRIAGDLAEQPPTFEMSLWLRHPVITTRAREIGKSEPGVGRTEAWRRARTELRTEKRNKALAGALHELVTRSAGDRKATIATHTYDLDAVAAQLRAGADHGALAELLAAQMAPERLAEAERETRKSRRRSGGKRSDRSDRAARPNEGEATLDQSGPVQAEPDEQSTPSVRHPAHRKSGTGRASLRSVRSDRMTQEDRVEALDRFYRDKPIPSRATVMTDMGWTSVSETGKAMAELRTRRERSSQPVRTEQSAPDDEEHVS